MHAMNDTAARQLGMPDMMQEAMDAAFGAVIREALQPILVKLADLEVQVTALTSQLDSAMELVDQVRNGKGMLARFLNGG